MFLWLNQYFFRGEISIFLAQKSTNVGCLNFQSFFPDFFRHIFPGFFQVFSTFYLGHFSHFSPGQLGQKTPNSRELRELRQERQKKLEEMKKAAEKAQMIQGFCHSWSCCWIRWISLMYIPG
jgi:hypothetical protein